MVVAVLGRGDVEEGLVLGRSVGVQQHLLGAAAHGFAGVDGVLGSVRIAGVVDEGAVGGGDGAVVLLDPAAHLGKQLGLQVLGRGELGASVGVLRLEVGADVGTQNARVAHDLLPVLILQPGVVVGPHAPELLDPLGPHVGGGSQGRQGTGGGVIHGRSDRAPHA